MTEFKAPDLIYSRLKSLFDLSGHNEGSALQPIDALPQWMRRAFRFHFFKFGELTLVLVIPKSGLEFEALRSGFQMIAKYWPDVSPLLLADSVSSKSYGALTRSKIPYITSAGALVAPQLGLVMALKQRRIASHATPVKHTLSSLGLKLIAGHLLHQKWAESFSTLEELKEKFMGIGHVTSRVSLSRAIQQLAELELFHVTGSGPKKTYNFLDRDLLWRNLTRITVETFSETVYANEAPDHDWKNPLWVYSGESALEHLSDLNAGTLTTIAMKSDKYRDWWKAEKQSVTVNDEHPKVRIQIWKSDPTLGRVDKCVNEIELALSLRHESEPRIHLAVAQMLEKFNLNGSYLWEKSE